MDQDGLVAQGDLLIRQAADLDEPKAGQCRESDEAGTVRGISQPVDLFDGQEPLPTRLVDRGLDPESSVDNRLSTESGGAQHHLDRLQDVLALLRVLDRERHDRVLDERGRDLVERERQDLGKVLERLLPSF